MAGPPPSPAGRVRPSAGAGIPRRVFGHYRLLLLLAPAALPHVAGFPGPGVLRRLRPARAFGRRRAYPPPPGREAAAGTATGGSHVHCCPVNGLGTRLCPCGIATATPQAFTVASQPRPYMTRQEFPARHAGGGCAPPTSPYPPDLSWRTFKRRNSTGSLRIPSRLAHRAWPVWQYQTDATLSRLLPPSPATPGSGCLQLHPAAATAGKWRSSTSIRKHSASWRTPSGASRT